MYNSFEIITQYSEITCLKLTLLDTSALYITLCVERRKVCFTAPRLHYNWKRQQIVFIVPFFF